MNDLQNRAEITDIGSHSQTQTRTRRLTASGNALVLADTRTEIARLHFRLFTKKLLLPHSVKWINRNCISNGNSRNGIFWPRFRDTVTKITLKNSWPHALFLSSLVIYAQVWRVKVNGINYITKHYVMKVCGVWRHSSTVPSHATG
jgi:hypothetical protein